MDALPFVEGCIERYAEQAWRAAYVMLSNAADADDLLQQAFLVAWRKAEHAPRDNPWPWLAAIIAHEARNFRRKRSRRRGPSLESISEPEMVNEPNLQLERAELAAVLHANLARLDEDQRIAIVLTHLSGLTQSEAANALGVPLNTVKARVRRGLDHLRERMGRVAPDLEHSLKTLPVAPPIGGIIAAKAAWSASLGSKVAIGGAAGAGGFKGALAAAAVVMILTAGVIVAVAAPGGQPQHPRLAAELADEPAKPALRLDEQQPRSPSGPLPAPHPVVRREGGELRFPVPDPGADAQPAPAPLPAIEPLPAPAREPEPPPQPAESPAPPQPAEEETYFDGRGFWEVWMDKQASALAKFTAVSMLMGGEELIDEYLEVLESDVWQYRKVVVERIQAEQNTRLLAKLENFLFDEKEAAKRPAAAEHVCWALYNNQHWANDAKWRDSSRLLDSKRTPEAVKARMLRELGVFRGSLDDAYDLAQAFRNIALLLDQLERAVADKGYDPELKFLISHALCGLLGKDCGDNIDLWRSYARAVQSDDSLSPIAADEFLEEHGRVKLTGRTLRRGSPAASDVEILVLPDFGCSSLYWQPYVKLFAGDFRCTLIDLPDFSGANGLEYPRNEDGTANRSAYFFPIAQFVNLLEARRKLSTSKQIALVAHGFSGWIAMEYMRLYPKSVAFSVIVSSWSGSRAYEASIKFARDSKDETTRCFAESQVVDPSGLTGALSMSEADLFSALTGWGRRRWADPKALEPILFASPAWHAGQSSGAQALLPNFELQGAKKIDVPTLFVHGLRDPLFADKDEAAYKRVFTKLAWVEFKDSAATPWAEEPLRFEAEFDKFLEFNKLASK